MSEGSQERVAFYLSPACCDTSTSIATIASPPRALTILKGFFKLGFKFGEVVFPLTGSGRPPGWTSLKHSETIEIFRPSKLGENNRKITQFLRYFTVFFPFSGQFGNNFPHFGGSDRGGGGISQVFPRGMLQYCERKPSSLPLVLHPQKAPLTAPPNPPNSEVSNRCQGHLRGGTSRGTMRGILAGGLEGAGCPSLSHQIRVLAVMLLRWAKSPIAHR